MSRPFGITALSIFFFAATGITLVAAVSLLLPNGLLEPIWKLNTLLFVFDFLQPDCNLQWSADLIKIDLATGQWGNVAPNFGTDANLYTAGRDFWKRFDTAFDPKALYVGYNCILVTRDGAQTWKAFSPDRGSGRGACTAGRDRARLAAAGCRDGRDRARCEVSDDGRCQGARRTQRRRWRR